MRKMIFGFTFVVIFLVLLINGKIEEMLKRDDEESHHKGKAPDSEKSPIPANKLPFLEKDNLAKIEGEAERNELVQRRLNKFLQGTAQITAESVRRERERIARALHAAEDSPFETPKSSHITDGNQDKWERLDYGNGIVRYLPLLEGGGDKNGF